MIIVLQSGALHFAGAIDYLDCEPIAIQAASTVLSGMSVIAVCSRDPLP